LRFKSTQNIFKDLGELLDPNWLESDKIILPPKKDWDYRRTITIEDVNVWEVIYEQSGGIGVYAAWDPYAEFYMIKVGWFLEEQGYGAELYYGPGAMDNMMKRAKELGIPISTNKVWVEPDEMWLYKEA
jgi:hypothetical protein